MQFIYLFLTLSALKAANCELFSITDPLVAVNDIFHYNLGGAPEKVITAVVNHGDEGVVTETLQVVYFDKVATLTTKNHNELLSYYGQAQHPSVTVTYTIQDKVTAPVSDFTLIDGNYYLLSDKLDDINQYATMTLSPI